MCSSCLGTGYSVKMSCVCGGAGCFYCGYKGTKYITCTICNGEGVIYKKDSNSTSSGKKPPHKMDALSWAMLAFFGFLILKGLSGKPQNNNPSPQPNPVIQGTPNGSLSTPVPKPDQNNITKPNRPENQLPNAIGFVNTDPFSLWRKDSLWGKDFTKPVDQSVSPPSPKILRVSTLKANIRLEPDPKSLPLGTVAQGDLVTVLDYAQNAETGKQWTRIQAPDGVIGFIRSSLLEDQ